MWVAISHGIVGELVQENVAKKWSGERLFRLWEKSIIQNLKMKILFHINETKLENFGGNIASDPELNVCFVFLKWQNLNFEFISHFKEDSKFMENITDKTFFIETEMHGESKTIKSFYSLYRFLIEEGLLFS